tara:strand:+ start:336 stop:473 length:138 start_codon:yes stop_codon:yes gene_type:complete
MAVDLHNQRLSSISDQEDKVHARESDIEETLEEEHELMVEMRTEP